MLIRRHRCVAPEPVTTMTSTLDVPEKLKLLKEYFLTVRRQQKELARESEDPLVITRYAPEPHVNFICNGLWIWARIPLSFGVKEFDRTMTYAVNMGDGTLILTAAMESSQLLEELFV